MSATRDVIAFAKRHGGIFTTREAMELGMPSTTISRRVSEGVFDRIGRGLLALPGTETRPDAQLLASGRVLGAVVSHQSAGRLHGMTPIPKSDPTVTVAHRRTYSFPDLVVHQSTDLLPEHTMKIRSLTVTNPARTIIDLTAVFSGSRVERIIDNALAAKAVDFDDLVLLYLALTRQGKKGMKQLGDVLRRRARGAYVGDTVLERRLFNLLVEAGVPKPTTQFHAPWLEPIDGRVDFAYEKEQIVLEADSRRWHGLFDAMETDRRRDIAAQLAGWIVLRVTWKMITEDPTFVVASVRQALALRSGVSRGA